MISACNECESVWLDEEDHAQVKTRPAFHDGAAELSDACALVDVRSAKRRLCRLEGFNDLPLVCRGKRFDPLAEAGR